MRKTCFAMFALAPASPAKTVSFRNLVRYGFPNINCHAAHVLNRPRISKVQVFADCKSLDHCVFATFPMRALLVKDGLKAS